MFKYNVYYAEPNASQWTEIIDTMSADLEWTDLIDNSLSSGNGGMYSVAPELFPRYTKFKLRISDDKGNTIPYTRYFLMNDILDQKSFMKDNYIFDKTTMFIEPTKLLQGYYIPGMSVKQPLTGEKITLYDTFVRLLETTPLRQVGEDIIWHYYTDTDNDPITNMLKETVSPEFVWDSTKNLYECLYEIGAEIGAKPRLTQNYTNPNPDYSFILFDLYMDEKKDISDIKYYAYREDCPEENYCTATETAVSNFMSIDETESSLIYPSPSGWVTARTDSGKLTDSNAKIMLPMPIYKVKHLWVNLDENASRVQIKYRVGDSPQHLWGIGNNGEVIPGQYIGILDIINNIKPFDEWNLIPLTDEVSDISVFQQSTCLAYEPGDNYIDLTMNFKRRLLGYTYVTENAIKNAIKTWFLETQPEGVLGVATSVDDVSFLDNPNLWDFNFRIEYVPYTGFEKIRSEKMYINGNFERRTLPYAQNAKIIDSRQYGRKMWGETQRLGVGECEFIVSCEKVNDFPRVGDKFKNKIVTRCDYKVKGTKYIDVKVIASENVNFMNDRIGINKEYRVYDIPLQADVRKTLAVNEYWLFSRSGNKTDEGGSTSYLRAQARSVFQRQKAAKNTKITVAQMQMWSGSEEYSGSGNNGSPVLMNLSSISFGKSMLFSGKMQDNYSAGVREYAIASGKYCSDVDYTVNGGGDYVRIYVGTDVSGTTHTFPLLDTSGMPVIDTPWINDIPQYHYRAKFDIISRKSVGEQIAFNYQIHGITDDQDIIIGEALFFNNPLVRNYSENRTFKLWNLNRSVNMFVRKINELYGEISSGTFSTADGSEIIVTGSFNKGWAITDDEGNLLLAENFDGHNAVTIRHIYNTFRAER